MTMFRTVEKTRLCRSCYDMLCIICMDLNYSINTINPPITFFTCCCSHFSAFQNNFFFKFRYEGLCLQALHIRINVYFGSLCRDDAIIWKKSSRKERIPSEISVVRNIPPSRDEIIRNAFFNGKYYLNRISPKYFVRQLLTSHGLNLPKEEYFQRLSFRIFAKKNKSQYGCCPLDMKAPLYRTL